MGADDGVRLMTSADAAAERQARTAAVKVAAEVLSSSRPDGGVEASPWPGDVAQLAHYIVTGDREGMYVPPRGGAA